MLPCQATRHIELSVAFLSVDGYDVMHSTETEWSGFIGFRLGQGSTSKGLVWGSWEMERWVLPNAAPGIKSFPHLSAFLRALLWLPALGKAGQALWAEGHVPPATPSTVGEGHCCTRGQKVGWVLFSLPPFQHLLLLSAWGSNVTRTRCSCNLWLVCCGLATSLLRNRPDDLSTCSGAAL